MPWTNDKWNRETDDEQFSWQGAPKDLQTANLDDNHLSSFSFTGSPSSLQKVYLHNNQLLTFSWKDAPVNLRLVLLSFNPLSTFSWKDAPANLQSVWFGNNLMTTFSWEDAPVSLLEVLICNCTITRFIGVCPPRCRVFNYDIEKKNIDWNKFEESEEECLICHEKETTNANKTIKLDCHNKHIYHINCLEDWFLHSGKEKCPLCFRSVDCS